jgi:hypothetical protein
MVNWQHMPVLPLGLLLLINGIMLGGAIILGLVLLTAGVQFSRSIGFPERQTHYKWVTLWSLMSLILMGGAAVILNFFFAPS